jgi:hypothetical protein
MNILYTFLNFNGLTGSELYYYELSREMVALGHKVTIASNCGGEIKTRAEANGVICKEFSEINDFSEFDIIHASHKPVLQTLCTHLVAKAIPIVVTIHSEILGIEKVESFPNIDYFIGIRPAIFDFLPKYKRSLIYNPIDFSRFNTDNTSNKGYIFFPGTINHLRLAPIEDVASIAFYADNSSEVQSKFGGAKFNDIVTMGENDLPGRVIPYTTHKKPIFNIEKYIKESCFTAGIIKGRTYIESILCGKTHRNYQVDNRGRILSTEELNAGDYLYFGDKVVHKSEFDSSVVAKKIEKIYENCI